MDLPGHGHSPERVTLARDATHEALIANALAYLKTQNLAVLGIGGHSEGAAVAGRALRRKLVAVPWLIALGAIPEALTLPGLRTALAAGRYDLLAPPHHALAVQTAIP